MVKNNVPYFGEKEEQAVIDFIKSESSEERDRLYNNILSEPFRKMIQSILRKYPTHIGNFTIHEVESDALSHLIDKMHKFDSETITKDGNKTKAYSYCQTIIRNYFREHGKKTYKEKKTNLNYDEYEFINNDKYSYELEYDNGYSDIYDTQLLIKETIIKIEEKIFNENLSAKKNDVAVGMSLINLLTNWKELFKDDYSKLKKNNMLLFLREQTGLDTKDIRNSMKLFKNFYFFSKYMKN